MGSVPTGAILCLNLFCSFPCKPLMTTLSTLYNLGKTVTVKTVEMFNFQARRLVLLNCTKGLTCLLIFCSLFNLTKLYIFICQFSLTFCLGSRMIKL